MKKFVKTTLMLVAGVAMLVAGTPVIANAAKTKVLSTRNIATTQVHGRLGNIYNSVKLSRVSHKMKNYRYTTWSASKKAVVKKNGKKAYVTYIKSGSKHGWIYSKYLTNGKAPFNKQKRLDNTYVAYNRAVMAASTSTQGYAKAYEKSYGNIANRMSYAWDGYSDGWKATEQDRAALLQVYQIFKGRFSASQNANLAAMAKDLDKQSVSEDTYDDVNTKMETFAETLSELVAELS